MVRKDFSNQIFGKLKAIKQDDSKSDKRYWLFECECGEIISRIPNALKHNNFNACRQCLTGENTWSWKGYREIPYDVFNTIKHGAKARNLNFDISIQYLWELYIKQNKKCSFTGWDITFNKTHSQKTSKTASLDRIDSSKGYVEGNLQWVHKEVNKLKKNLSDDLFIEICMAIARKVNDERLFGKIN